MSISCLLHFLNRKRRERERERATEISLSLDLKKLQWCRPPADRESESEREHTAYAQLHWMLLPLLAHWGVAAFFVAFLFCFCCFLPSHSFSFIFVTVMSVPLCCPALDRRTRHTQSKAFSLCCPPCSK